MTVADHSESPANALRRAVRAMRTQTAMAELVGVTQAAVSIWLSKGQSLPPEHVLAVEAATGISRHDLRPDIYPRDSAPVDHATTRMEPAR